MNRDPFAAIADPTRREIIGHLAGHRLSINQLAEKMPAISRPAVSKQVKYLEECGMVSIEQVGRERYCVLYSLALAEVQEWIGQYEKFWNARLDQLGQYLDDNEKDK